MKKRKCPFWKKCVYSGAAGLTFMNAVSASVSATTWSGLNLAGSSGGDANKALAKPIGLLITAIQVIGFVVLVYGFYDVISSFIQNNGEVKTRAIATVVVGLILASMKSVLQQCGIIQ